MNDEQIKALATFAAHNARPDLKAKDIASAAQAHANSNGLWSGADYERFIGVFADAYAVRRNLTSILQAHTARR